MVFQPKGPCTPTIKAEFKESNSCLNKSAASPTAHLIKQEMKSVKIGELPTQQFIYFYTIIAQSNQPN